MKRSRLNRSTPVRRISPRRRQEMVADAEARAACLAVAMNRCQKCSATAGLECHHIVTRSVRRLRWNLLNLLALCHCCHGWWHANPKAARAWFREKFGNERADTLGLKGETP